MPRQFFDDEMPDRRFMVDPPVHPLRPPLTRTDEGEPLLQTPGLTMQIPNVSRQWEQARALRRSKPRYPVGSI